MEKSSGQESNVISDMLLYLMLLYDPKFTVLLCSGLRLVLFVAVLQVT